MPPRPCTALFFLDEVTALSAGHRPWGYCRREDHLAFAEAWRVGHGSEVRPQAAELHAASTPNAPSATTRQKRTRPVSLGSLPDRAKVGYDGAPSLVLGGALLQWSLAGYNSPRLIAPTTQVDLLTPPGTITTIATGYRPLAHPNTETTPLRTPSPTSTSS